MMSRLAAAAFLACAITSLAAGDTGAFAPTTVPISPAGIRATADLPISQHMRNTGGMGRGGPGTGIGLCVFTSMTHAARWANIVDLEGFRKWMESKPGGGYPAKVDAMLAAWCKEKGIAVPAYVQHTGGDDAILDLAIRTGRCPCVTYAGSDDFYSGGIDHMVNLLHLDLERACILDNNRPGFFIWMTRAEFLTRWRARGGGWAVVFLDAPPPPYNTMPASVSCGCDGDEPCGCGPDCKCPRPAKVYGQCANGRCVAPPSMSRHGPTPIGTPPSDRHEWGEFPEGGYGWRFKTEPPATAGDVLPTGVVSDRIHEAPAYSRNGQEVTKDEAHAALGSSALADDTDRWHLAAVGDPAFIALFRADVAKLPAATRDKLLVQAYSPSAWQVAQFQLPSAGVLLRQPTTGRVSADVGMIPATEYSSTRLATLLGEPTGPTPRPPEPKPKPGSPDSPTPTSPSIPWQWVAAGVGGVILIRRK